jgi:hypothetical protein
MILNLQTTICSKKYIVRNPERIIYFSPGRKALGYVIKLLRSKDQVYYIGFLIILGVFDLQPKFTKY